MFIRNISFTVKKNYDTTKSAYLKETVVFLRFVMTHFLLLVKYSTSIKVLNHFRLITLLAMQNKDIKSSTAITEADLGLLQHPRWSTL